MGKRIAAMLAMGMVRAAGASAANSTATKTPPKSPANRVRAPASALRAERE